MPPDRADTLTASYIQPLSPTDRYSFFRGIEEGLCPPRQFTFVFQEGVKPDRIRFQKHRKTDLAGLQVFTPCEFKKIELWRRYYLRQQL